MTACRRLVLLLIAVLLCACGDYVVENDAVYYRSSGWLHRIQVEGADAASFRTLDREYAVDRSRAYFRGRHIEGAIPSKIERIDDSEYAHDGRNVYSQTERVPGADVASFRPLGGFGIDRHRAYSGSVPRELCAIGSLSADRHGWYTDSACVYSPVNLERIVEADRATFQSLDSYRARDARRGYSLLSPSGMTDDPRYRLRLVDDICDIDSLRSEQGWLLDRRCVYGRDFVRIEEIDRASFRVITSHYAADRTQVFDAGGAVRTDLDPATARTHGRHCTTCIRDDTRCFVGEEAVSCPRWR